VGALARARGFSDATRRAHEVLALVGLADRATQVAGGLTLSDRKRLELARALATEPRLLLLDEVMAGLTSIETARMIDLCRAINARGTAILLIEHVMSAVMALSRRIVVLNQGTVIATGPPGEIARDRRVVEAYLGEADGDAPAGGHAGA
jgi:branched-chain amino acid transport system ATP-binding protein